MEIGRASGAQIAFFTFAGLLLLVPATKWVVRAHEWSPDQAAFIERCLAILAMGVVLLAIPPLRRWSTAQLRIPVPAHRRKETVVMVILGPLFAFAVVGAMALLRWVTEGPSGLAQWARAWSPHDAEMRRALSATGVAMVLVVAVIGPIVEELVFRGLLYRVWERRWGFLAAMVLSSAVFGLYHAVFWAAFVHGLLFVALYRRTGSLLAPILAHGTYNAALWYPLLGRFVFPGSMEIPGDLASWSFHLACLLAASIAVPWYVLAARTPFVSAPSPETGREPLPS